MVRVGGRVEDAVTRNARASVHLALLAAAVAIGAFLRFDSLGGPSFWLDEILHQNLTTDAAAQPWWRWIAGFSPEHGPLYYATQLAARAFASGETAARLAPALLGVATIVLVWLAARALGLSAATAPVAALLVAVSPLHVYFSREARSYSLLMFLTAAAIVVLLRRRSPALAIAVLIALLYASAVAAPVLAAAFLVCCILGLLSTGSERRWSWMVAGAATICGALLPLIYASRPVADTEWPGFPAMTTEFAATLMRTYSVSATGADRAGRAAIALLIFAIVGAIALLKRNRDGGIVLVGMTLLPLGITLGALRALDHFYAARYVTAALIGFLLLSAVGIAFVAELAGRRVAGLSLALGVAVAALIAAQCWDAARTEAFQKLDWRGIAKTLAQYARPGDAIITSDAWTEVSLRYYMRQTGSKLDVGFHAESVALAGEMMVRAPAAWMITAGPGDTAVRQWMCRFPLVMASPLESFRMHYAPSLAHFLRERSGPAQQRAVAAALGARGFTLHMSSDDADLLGKGWAGAEGAGRDAFRWALGRRASIVFPRWGRSDRVIRFRALPMHDRAKSAQTVRVSVNGTAVGTVTLASGWKESAVASKAELWRDGMNDVALDFGFAVVPADVDANSNDHRELAACFDWISVDDAGESPSMERGAVPIRTIRADADRPIDADTSWRDARTAPSQPALRRDRLEALLGRLGFDPLTIAPRVASGSVQLEDLAQTLAWGSECVDDRTFVEQTAEALLGRRFGKPEQDTMLRALRSGVSRERLTTWFVRSAEFERENRAR